MPNEPCDRQRTRFPLEIAVLIKQTRERGIVQGEGFTRAVNAYGGLLDAPFRMEAGQHFSLANPRSQKEANCTVVQVGKPAEGFFPTAFEFFAYNPHFWLASCPPPEASTYGRNEG